MFSCVTYAPTLHKYCSFVVVTLGPDTPYLCACHCYYRTYPFSKNRTPLYFLCLILSATSAAAPPPLKPPCPSPTAAAPCCAAAQPCSTPRTPSKPPLNHSLLQPFSTCYFLFWRQHLQASNLRPYQRTCFLPLSLRCCPPCILMQSNCFRVQPQPPKHGNVSPPQPPSGNYVAFQIIRGCNYVAF